MLCRNANPIARAILVTLVCPAYFSLCPVICSSRIPLSQQRPSIVEIKASATSDVSLLLVFTKTANGF